MRLIIPMAGQGKRLRPHTLSTPKPLFKLIGKSVVAHLCELLRKQLQKPFESIYFVVHRRFGSQNEKTLLNLAEQLDAEGYIVYQDQPLGTAHAIHCASNALEGEVLIAFADTLFFSNFQPNSHVDGCLWVKEVEDPSAFGVVQLDEQGYITNLVEKPEVPPSHLAIVGIYYIKEGKWLEEGINYLLKEGIKSKGEYQLTDALMWMVRQGAKLVPAPVEQWMDCGNKNAILDTQKKLFQQGNYHQIAPSVKQEHCLIIPPVYIQEGAIIKDAVIGPFVSIEENAMIEKAIIQNTIVKSGARIKNVVLENSIVGSCAVVEGASQQLDISDFSRSYYG